MAETIPIILTERQKKIRELVHKIGNEMDGYDFSIIVESLIHCLVITTEKFSDDEKRLVKEAVVFGLSNKVPKDKKEIQ